MNSPDGGVTLVPSSTSFSFTLETSVSPTAVHAGSASVVASATGFFHDVPGPVGPVGPVAPVVPLGPSAPVVPLGPSGPVAPVAPFLATSAHHSPSADGVCALFAALIEMYELSPSSTASPFAYSVAAEYAPRQSISPRGPVAPSAPVVPFGPSGPVAPVVPFAPAAPSGPVAPLGPSAPAAPVPPVPPVGPVAPVAPFSASTPHHVGELDGVCALFAAFKLT